MNRNIFRLSVYLSLMCCALPLLAQSAASADSVVPGMVKFTGALNDSNGRPLTGTVGVTFLLYTEQSGGAPLWAETQNIQADKNGHYSVMLGSTTNQGIPANAFAAGQARWIGVQPSGQAEQPRVELGSVPYALKAADAQTLGGLPPSAFLLASPSTSTDSAAAAEAATSQSPAGTKPVTTAGGTAQALAKFDGTADIASSEVFDDGTHVGVGTKTPKAKLDVKGDSILRGKLTLPATGTATTTAGTNSQPLNLSASVFDSGTQKASTETFAWRSEPMGNNTREPFAKLGLLFGGNGSTPSDTGLSISPTGIVSFVPGQTFPGTGNGTVTSVGLTAPLTDFTVTGSPVTSSGALNLQWLVPPTGEDVANAIVKRDSDGDIAVNALTVDGFISSNGVINALTGVNGFGLGSVVGNNAFAGAGEGDGVLGLAQSTAGAGVVGINFNSGFGMVGLAQGNNGQGVWGESFGSQNSSNGFGPDGVDGISHSDLGSGVAAFNTAAGDGLFAKATTGFAGFFEGDVDVNGQLSKASGSFKIDHPLDPANKYLYHSFVESPDMKNLYDGVVDLDGNGEAVVKMPDWFESLNKDFRYQLTSIGAPGPNLYIAEEISGNQFKIAGGKPGARVSWLVTGTRHDAWANAHRIPVEQTKTGRESGLYLHPELFGAPPEKSIAIAHHPALKPSRGRILPHTTTK